MRLKHLLLFVSVIGAVFAIQGLHSHKAFAAGCGSATSNGTLSQFVSDGISCNGYDVPVLQTTGPTTVSGGSTITLHVGYNSAEPSYGARPHVITLANISLNGNPGTNLFSSISASGGTPGWTPQTSNSYCFDEVSGNDSIYHNAQWPNVAGATGRYFCDQEGNDYPITKTSSPVSTAPCIFLDDGLCSRASYPGGQPPGFNTGGGASAVFYNDRDYGYGNVHSYTLSINTLNPASNASFCVRVHVSVTGADVSGSWGSSLGSYNSLATQALSDIKGVSGLQCYTVTHRNTVTDVPPSFSLSADCHIIYMANLADPNNAGSGVHFYGAIYHRNPDGSRGGLAGEIDGRSLGSFPWDYRDPTHPPPNRVPTEAQNDNYGWSIDVGVTNINIDGSDGAFGYVQTVNVGQCYTAACTSLTVDSPLSGTTNGVPANSTFTVTATFHNTQPTTTTNYLPGVLSDGSRNYNLGATIYNEPPWGGNIITPYARDVPAGQDFTVRISLKAPPGPATTPLIVYADYWQLFAIDQSACNINVNSYVPFHIDPKARAQLQTTIENPTDAYYRIWVDSPTTAGGNGPGIGNPNNGNTVNNNTVYVPTQATFYKIIGGAKTTVSIPPTAFGGTYAPGTSTFYYGSASPDPTLAANWVDYTIPHPPPNNAGDQYCAAITVAYTDGYVFTRPTEVAGTYGGNTITECRTVVNEPFSRTFNSAVRTDRSFQDSTGACLGGNLRGWNNNSGLYPGTFGAGSQLNAVSTNTIKGFASGQKLVPALNGYPTSLTFANQGVIRNPLPGRPPLPGGTGVTISPDSPKYGGNFGSSPCLNPPTASPPTAPPLGSSVDVYRLASGSYTVNQDTIIYASSALPTNRNISIQATNHNVHISAQNGGIKYNDDGTWTIGNVPSFNLVVTGGNIYIDPEVTELDGVYSAQPVYPTSTAVGGKIYTCGVRGPTGFVPMDVKFLYGSCYKQLTVYGVFQADQINLMRTLGSLRDETPIRGLVGFKSNTVTPCSNQRGIPLSSPRQTCAAEVFDFSPGLYLANPTLTPPNNGALQPSAYTSLPPVL